MAFVKRALLKHVDGAVNHVNARVAVGVQLYEPGRAASKRSRASWDGALRAAVQNILQSSPERSAVIGLYQILSFDGDAANIQTDGITRAGCKQLLKMAGVALAFVERLGRDVDLHTVVKTLQI